MNHNNKKKILEGYPCFLGMVEAWALSVPRQLDQGWAGENSLQGPIGLIEMNESVKWKVFSISYQPWSKEQKPLKNRDPS